MLRIFLNNGDMVEGYLVEKRMDAGIIVVDINIHEEGQDLVAIDLQDVDEIYRGHEIIYC